MNHTFQNKKGFTLIELLVAMGVFITVLTITVAIFVNALKGERLLTELVAINNNAGIVLEQMVREMRTGYNFTNSGSCESSITFANSQYSDPAGNNATTTYTLASGGIIRQGGGGSGLLTSSNTEVKNLCFKVLQYGGGGARPECDPARIVVSMKVGPKNSGEGTPDVTLETVVSSRVIPSEIKDDPYACKSK